MKILFLADLHDVDYSLWKKFLQINENFFDLIATLGDIDGIYLKQIKETFSNKRIIGVLGNHDPKRLLNKYNIEDIHRRVITVNDITIAGIEGCVIYKK